MTSRPWGVRGLTEAPKAPVIARAKIGKKREDGAPQRLDHIIFVEPGTSDTTCKEIPAYRELFGDKPTEFPALLPADTLEENADVAWKRYGTTGLQCRGDGDQGYEKATGEVRECAGDYDPDDPVTHLCPYARPTTKNGKERPPECKPVLSMRLVVPQLPGLGVVQIDTGGVASSIPTLVAQLRMIEQLTTDAKGHPHMAGVAVRVFIRPFPDKFGKTAWSWMLEPLTGSEARELHGSIEGLVRVQGQIAQQIKELPALEERVDSDIYGIEGPATEEDDPDTGPLPDLVVASDDAFDERLAQAVRSGKVPKAKAEAAKAERVRLRDKAVELGDFTDYLDWIAAQTEKVPR